MLGNKSNENSVPTKMLLEKPGLGKRSKPKNKPVNIDIIAVLSINLF
tara:strand:+ start:457 stop:597 length:141 start_codon:yes stop_codon:yes gene_type:complete